ncbi:FG-GAP repeat domain-containing protein, partial [Hymenobacter persicinus]|uniref:FG-GAP repeat domain-containing protein n=1 Tax=Hymenobacter persicinus TaxID=2025506 RepID=UPI0013EA516E
RLNNGSGVFSVPPVVANGTIAIANGPTTIVAADLDGDGDVDFATGNFNGNNVTPRFNNGTPAPDLLISTTGQSISAGTYNSITITGTGAATLQGAVTVNSAVTVQNGGSLSTNCQPLTGAATFTLAAGATLIICDPAGITASGASGAVQTTNTRSFSNDAIYSYSGSSAQVTGSGLPSQVRELVVNNPAGLTLSAPLAVAQRLRLTSTSGNFALNGQALTLLSNASGTALVTNEGAAVVSGTATVQRYIDPSLNAGLGYRHYSSPVQSTTVADLATANFSPVVNPAYNTVGNTVTPFPTVFGFDEARITSTSAATQSFDNGYFSPASLSTPLTVGRGYTVNLAASEKVDLVG